MLPAAEPAHVPVLSLVPHPHRVPRLKPGAASTPGTTTPEPFKPWNLGKLVGQKPPLKLREVWAIRIRLQIQERLRNLAMFNLAIDSKLRGCDLVALRVDDVLLSGRVRPRTTVIQKKAGRPVQFAITEQTRETVVQWITKGGRRSGDYLFPSRIGKNKPLTTRHYARLGHLDRFGPGPLRHPLTAAEQGGPDLPTHRQPPRGPTAARTH